MPAPNASRPRVRLSGRHLRFAWSLMVVSLLPGSIGSALADTVAAGLCVQLGDVAMEETLRLAPRYVVHRLDRDAKRVQVCREELTELGLYGRVTVDHWPAQLLPHVDNLANLVIVGADFEIEETELRRIAVPGGLVIRRSSEGEQTWRKPIPDGTDQWTHQWRGPSGSVSNADKSVGVPTGIQWIQGPLFAMANRKSSTQSLVSAKGRNFYVTQNVAENLRPEPSSEEMPQWLVARDSYNGMMLWKRPWVGPFVSGDGETNPRMVAGGDRLWVAGQSAVLELDTSNGEQLSVYSTTAPPSKLLSHEGLLVAESSTGIAGFRDGVKAWDFAKPNLYGTVGSSGRLFALIAERGEQGVFSNRIIAIDPSTGQQVWEVDTSPWTQSRRLQITFAEDGYLAVQSHGYFHVFSQDDGAHLWSRTTDARPGKDYSDERYVGHLYQNGLVWLMDENSPRTREGQGVWLGLDPKTGKQNRILETAGFWPRTAAPAKMGCQLIIANERYIMIPRQATFIDFETGDKHDFKFIRGGCGLGFVPANGLIYTHPHACGCFSEAVRGFIAVHSRGTPTADDIEQAGPRRVLGPHVTECSAATNRPSTGDTDWPTHRHDSSRSGATTHPIPAAPQVLWSASVTLASKNVESEEWRLRVGPRVTAPVVVGETAYVADVQGHRVVTLDVNNGSQRWAFTTGSRIDSPPTIHDGKCYFGSRDGYAYCLAADSGELLWRYRMAPIDQRIMVHGQLESPWPVSGSLLVQNGFVFASAGRAPDADGGITVVALDPNDGTLRWNTTVKDDIFGLSDLLVGDGENVFLSNLRIDPTTGASELLDSNSTVHLRGGKMGLLEASWTEVDLALRKEIHDWNAFGTTGQLLSFVSSSAEPNRAAFDVNGFRLSESGQAELFSSAAGWQKPLDQPKQIHAMVIAGDSLIVAGANRRDDTTGSLMVISRTDGKTLSETQLSSTPVFDGMAVAQNRIFVSLQSGEVVCLGE